MDAEVGYALYCLHKFHWEPSKFMNLPRREKAFIIACIDERIKQEKAEQAKVRAEENTRRNNMSTIKNKIELDDKMTPVLNKMLKSMSSMLKLMKDTDKTSEKSFSKVSKDIQQAENELMKFANTAQLATDQLEDLGNASGNIKGPSGSFASSLETFQQLSTGIGGAIYTAKEIAQAVKEVGDASDRLTLMNARLGLITDDVDKLEQKIYTTAQSSRGNFQNMAATVASLGMQAGEAFNNSEDEIIKFSDTLNKMFTVSGLDQSGISSVMYNLTQSLSSGALLGQDYRILRQNAPKFREALMDYYGVSASELQNMVSNGQVSAQDVKLAMFQAADEINEQFAKIPMTFAQATDQIKNTITRFTIPLNNRLSKILNSAAVQRFLRKIEKAIILVMTVIDQMLSIIEAVFDYLEPMLGWLGFVIDMIAVFLTTRLLANIVELGVEGGKALLGLIAKFMALEHVEASASAMAATYATVAVGALALTEWAGNEIVYDGKYNLKDFLASTIFVLLVIADVIGMIVKAVWDIIVFVGMIVLEVIGGIMEAILGVIWAVTYLFDLMAGTSSHQAIGNLMGKVGDWMANMTSLSYMVDPTGGIDSFEDNARKSWNIVNKMYGETTDMNNTLGSGIDVNAVNSTVNATGEMSITEEDLKLLKDIAATEFVNRYTTLRPSLNASFGDVRETADVDAIMERIGDMMEEALAESLY